MHKNSHLLSPLSTINFTSYLKVTIFLAGIKFAILAINSLIIVPAKYFLSTKVSHIKFREEKLKSVGIRVKSITG